MSEIQSQLDYADAVAESFLDQSESCIQRNDLENALNFIHIAASILCRQNRNLFSEKIELQLCYIANKLTYLPRDHSPFSKRLSNKTSCLHVLDEALPAGGLTKMALRWVKNDPERIHHIALLSQESPLPQDVMRIVHETGGDLHMADSKATFLSRAIWLKELSNTVADVVILHIGVSDVICGVAYGIKGGPPVVIVNHAAHIFWTGVSVADLVLNCRGSELEKRWTETYRGAKSAILPIPLEEFNSGDFGETLDNIQRREAKKIIGIAADSVLILTVGASFKYLPINELDFLSVCQDILNEVPAAVLVAVGVNPDDRWNAAAKRVGLRIKAMGAMSQSQLNAIRKAADIYIESFPFGSTTSLLEAGYHGIPCVLAPAECPPPYATDGVAVDNILDRPKTINDFKSDVIHLCNHPTERVCLGEKIKQSVTNHHIGIGWKKYLYDVIEKMPRFHQVRENVSQPIKTPENVHEYWAKFISKHNYGYEETLEHAIALAHRNGLSPVFTDYMEQVCKKFSGIRRNHSIPLPILAFLLRVIFPALPKPWASIIFRFFSFIFRGHFMKRVKEKAIKLILRKGGVLWYQEYRNIKS